MHAPPLRPFLPLALVACAQLYLIHAPDNQGTTDEEIVRLRTESWVAMEEAHAAGTLVTDEERERLLAEKLAEAPPSARGEALVKIGNPGGAAPAAASFNCASW